MRKSKVPKVLFCLPVCFILLLTSCGFFETEIEVTPCSGTGSTNFVDTLSDHHGIVSLVDVEINGIAVQKWVILPKYSPGKIYVPCNLPHDGRVKSKEVYFNGKELDHSPNPQDTVLQGFTFIELTYLKND
jgi:hypothetical protein